MEMQAHGIALRLPAYGPRLAVNTSIWAVGVALECLLAFSVFFKRIARRFPAFATLLVFFPLRAALLFALHGRIDSELYDSIYRVLSVVEYPLQLFLAVEIGYRLMREAGGWTGWRRFVPAAILAVAGVLAWGAVTIVSGKTRADPVEVFVWFVMVGLFAAVVEGSRSRNLFRISAGFAAFSILQLLVLAGRTQAFLGRDAGLYSAWSYVPAVGYLAVVVYWLIVLRREYGEDAMKKIAAATESPAETKSPAAG